MMAKNMLVTCKRLIMRHINIFIIVVSKLKKLK